MKKTLLALATAFLLVSISGCANGPLSQWFRGSACNVCNPPLGQPADYGANYASTCDNGCEQPRRGLFDWFRRAPDPAPVSLPGSAYSVDPGVPYYGPGAVAPGTVEIPQNAVGTGALQDPTITNSDIYGSSLQSGTPPTVSPDGT